mmetsp:Transcript_4174/g.5801  ORF Transcript_4174/g.5801 Transcript_4174/m.5801 type:complete len:221 (+) Transcript_4174:359-1021(+)
MFGGKDQIIGMLSIQPGHDVRCLVGQDVRCSIPVIFHIDPFGQNAESTDEVDAFGDEPVECKFGRIHDLIGVGVTYGISHTYGIDVFRRVGVYALNGAGEGTTGYILSLLVVLVGGLCIQLGEEGNEGIFSTGGGDVDGMHGHFVHEENGKSIVVEDVIDKGTEGCSRDIIVGGGRCAECSRCAYGYDCFGLFFYRESNVVVVVIYGGICVGVSIDCCSY